VTAGDCVNLAEVFSGVRVKFCHGGSLEIDAVARCTTNVLGRAPVQSASVTTGYAEALAEGSPPSTPAHVGTKLWPPFGSGLASSLRLR